MKSRVAHLLAGGNVQLPVKQEQVNRIAQLTQIVHEKSLGYRSCVPTLVLALNSRGNGAFTLPAVGAPCSPFFSRRPVTKSRVDRFYSHLFLILHFRSVSEKDPPLYYLFAPISPGFQKKGYFDSKYHKSQDF